MTPTQSASQSFMIWQNSMILIRSSLSDPDKATDGNTVNAEPLEPKAGLGLHTHVVKVPVNVLYTQLFHMQRSLPA